MAGVTKRLQRFVVQLLENIADELAESDGQEESTHGLEKKEGDAIGIKSGVDITEHVFSKKTSMRSMARYLSTANVFEEDEDITSKFASTQNETFDEMLLSIRDRPRTVREELGEERENARGTEANGVEAPAKVSNPDEITLAELLSAEHEMVANQTTYIEQAKDAMVFQPAPILQRPIKDSLSQGAANVVSQMSANKTSSHYDNRTLASGNEEEPKHSSTQSPSSLLPLPPHLQGTSVYFPDPPKALVNAKSTSTSEQKVTVTTRSCAQSGSWGSETKGARSNKESDGIESILSVQSCAVGHSAVTPQTLRNVLIPSRPGNSQGRITPRIVHLRFGNASSTIAKREYRYRQQALQQLGHSKLDRQVNTVKSRKKPDFLPLFPPLSDALKKRDSERKSAASPSRLKPWTVEGAPPQFL